MEYFELKGERGGFQYTSVAVFVHTAGEDKCEKLGQEVHKNITLMSLRLYLDLWLLIHALQKAKRDVKLTEGSRLPFVT